MSSSVHFSEDFSLNCGAVAVDIAAHKVLLVYFRDTNLYMLPKGRKNVNEMLFVGALRQVLEQTGYVCDVLPLQYETHAKTPANSIFPPSPLITEAIAVTQFDERGVQKIIHWYAAKGNSEADRMRVAMSNAEPYWVDINEAIGLLAFVEDQQVADRVLSTVVWPTKPMDPTSRPFQPTPDIPSEPTPKTLYHPNFDSNPSVNKQAKAGKQGKGGKKLAKSNSQIKGGEKGVVKDDEKGPIKDGENGLVKDGKKGLVKDNEKGPIKNGEDGLVKDGENGLVNGNKNGLVENGEKDLTKGNE